MRFDTVFVLGFSSQVCRLSMEKESYVCRLTIMEPEYNGVSPARSLEVSGIDSLKILRDKLTQAIDEYEAQPERGLPF
jgi:hypothetical protein